MAMSQRMWIREQERKKRERMRRARRRRNCAILVVVLAALAVFVIVMMNKNNTKPIEVTETEKPQITDASALSAPYTTTITTDDIKASFFKDSAFAGNALAQTIGTYGILKDAEFYTSVNLDVNNVYKVTPRGSTTPVSEQFKSKRFSKVFLTFGENELADMSSTEFKDEYAKLVDKIQEYQPNARIYLISIPPVTAEVSNGGEYTMQKIMQFNKRIMSIAVDEEIYYIDSVDALGDNKDFLPKGVSYDGINLNKAATIDLLYYMTKDSYIPDAEDLERTGSDEEDEDEDEDASSTPSPQKTAKPSPSPTVNVFKDKKPKGDM